MTFEQLRAALQDYFCDTSRSPGATKFGLKCIAEEALMLVETIPDDVDHTEE